MGAGIVHGRRLGSLGPAARAATVAEEQCELDTGVIGVLRVAEKDAAELAADLALGGMRRLLAYGAPLWVRPPHFRSSLRDLYFEAPFLSALVPLMEWPGFVCWGVERPYCVERRLAAGDAWSVVAMAVPASGGP
eukprot:jgi/Tetstr1/454593/TSEL_041487.t1